MRFSKHLEYLFHVQNGHCHYCLQPMWRKAVGDFAKRHGISTAQARWLQATTEHLKARCDGGSNLKQNLVAACRFCNQQRHKARCALPPARYSIRVRKRLASGKWHCLRLTSQVRNR